MQEGTISRGDGLSLLSEMEGSGVDLYEVMIGIEGWERHSRVWPFDIFLSLKFLLLFHQ